MARQAIVMWNVLWQKNNAEFFIPMAHSSRGEQEKHGLRLIRLAEGSRPATEMRHALLLS